MKAFYCEFETDYKESSYFNVLAASKKNQAMQYVDGVLLGGFFLFFFLAAPTKVPCNGRQSLIEEILSEQAYGILMIDIYLRIFFHPAPSLLPLSALSILSYFSLLPLLISYKHLKSPNLTNP